jgi:3-methylcrotonyl-CoA carboxylase alpha subunit
MEAGDVSAPLRLTIGGREVVVTLTATGDGWDATVDGASHAIACTGRQSQAATGSARVETLVLEIDGRVERVVVARTRERTLVAAGGRVHVVTTADGSERGAHGAVGSGVIAAPMPGKIIAVLVAPGDTVATGDPLVVLEAMKMETTLAAEVGGQITAVHVTPGTMVDGGAVLVEITPA